MTQTVRAAGREPTPVAEVVAIALFDGVAPRLPGRAAHA